MINRTRWAAIGAAIAVTVGGGVITVANATVSEGTRAVFVPNTPCRLFDMRPAPNQVGPRGTALTTNETYTQQVVGNNGNCSIPGDAVAVAMNVTAVDPTAPAFLTIWPADAEQPLASNLNYVAGAPPTPNKVDVKLSADGAIKLFNSNGNVFILADVVGYYADHNHDDRYYTKAQTDSAIAAIPAGAPGATGAPGAAGPAGPVGPVGATGIGVANLGFTSTVIADSPSLTLGSEASIQIGVDGLPVISYMGGSTLFVAHCSNPACTSATTTPVVTDDSGAGASLAIGSDGLPVISHRGPGFALRVIHCDDVACSSSTSHIVDDTAETVGVFSSITIGSDGLPIVAHENLTAKNLRVSHCDDVVCTSALTTVIDDPADLVGREPAITIGTDGLAIISHFDDTVKGLRITRCTTLTCNAATSTTVDDVADIVGQASSITIGSDGLPIVASRNASVKALRVSHCNDIACTSAVSTNVDSTGTLSGTTPDIAIGADGMAIATHSDNPEVHASHCSNLACTTATNVVATRAPAAGFGAALTIGADGMPVFAMFDVPLLALRVVHCSNVFCTPFFRRE